MIKDEKLAKLQKSVGNKESRLQTALAKLDKSEQGSEEYDKLATKVDKTRASLKDAETELEQYTDSLDYDIDEVAEQQEPITELKAEFTTELTQDLIAVYGIDTEVELEELSVETEEETAKLDALKSSIGTLDLSATIEPVEVVEMIEVKPEPEKDVHAIATEIEAQFNQWLSSEGTELLLNGNSMRTVIVRMVKSLESNIDIRDCFAGYQKHVNKIDFLRKVYNMVVTRK